MNTTRSHPSAARLAVVYMLAELLERLERSREPVGAQQYRSVVTHLAAEFETLASDEALAALLAAHPAASELYENLHYAHAGLCRSPLDAALAAELRARDAIERAKRATGHDAARPAAG